MAKMIHSMIRVQDLAGSIKFYHELFGFEVRRTIEFDQFSLTYLGNSESHFELELTHNFANTAPYQLGNGYGHLALSSDNIEFLWQKAKTQGYQPSEIKSLNQQEQQVAKFFFVTDPDGYQLEVIERNHIFN
ncbi:VOC family protein [Pseudoalteromonas obscura]|uniref:Aldoketomutase n=1 Tax=Pseudoalteromonas obscura TaxID=3048491 RepID=A0ABT7ELF7_9GAMM|nr:VOC family protein [Pseudoalteromonas sp. P94(2023)]MDK2595868.1 VOC family protein [Pseudoalteromonas sp. P94(2023)]